MKLNSLKKLAWQEFSKFIRIADADDNWIGECVTCGRRLPWQELQAGHFIAGRNNAILFEKNAVHSQCYICNCMLHGNIVEYYPFMLERYGQEEVDRLKRLRNETVKFTPQELVEKINYYRASISVFTGADYKEYKLKEKKKKKTKPKVKKVKTESKKKWAEKCKEARKKAYRQFKANKLKIKQLN